MHKTTASLDPSEMAARANQAKQRLIFNANINVEVDEYTPLRR